MELATTGMTPIERMTARAAETMISITHLTTPHVRWLTSLSLVKLDYPDQRQREDQQDDICNNIDGTRDDHEHGGIDASIRLSFDVPDAWYWCADE
jgi:hypothetical protein